MCGHFDVMRIFFPYSAKFWNLERTEQGPYQTWPHEAASLNAHTAGESNGAGITSAAWRWSRKRTSLVRVRSILPPSSPRHFVFKLHHHSPAVRPASAKLAYTKRSDPVDMHACTLLALTARALLRVLNATHLPAAA
jgi:hypothetical protein